MRNVTLLVTLLLLNQVGMAPGAQAANHTTKQLTASAKTVTGMPIGGTYVAPGNIALQQQGWKQLPPTRLDSFVKESGWNDAIYGDEGGGFLPLPPYEGFEPENRINAGIYGDRDQGLTTGHASVLPSAWGYDEFMHKQAPVPLGGAPGQEWNYSGPTGLVAPPQPLVCGNPVVPTLPEDMCATGGDPPMAAGGAAHTVAVSPWADTEGPQ